MASTSPLIPPTNQSRQAKTVTDLEIQLCLTLSPTPTVSLPGNHYTYYILYINTNRTDQPAGKHFNVKQHSKSDMRVFILERVLKQDPAYRKERESHLIRKFNTFYKGMNKSPSWIFL